MGEVTREHGEALHIPQLLSRAYPIAVRAAPDNSHFFCCMYCCFALPDTCSSTRVNTITKVTGTLMEVSVNKQRDLGESWRGGEGGETRRMRRSVGERQKDPCLH